jgi:hypothetical protein
VWVTAISGLLYLRGPSRARLRERAAIHVP